MTTVKKLPAIFAGLALLFVAGTARAGQEIIARLDHSQIFAMARVPATVVVGNPSIADVTIEGTNVFVHARAYGETNVLVLDEGGKQLADYDVVVQPGGGNGVYVFKAGASYSYICAPDCQSTLHVGDDTAWYDAVAKQQISRNNIALGQKSGEAAKPDQPPQ